MKLEIENLKLNLILDEMSLQEVEEEINDEELADDTKWVRVQQSKKKRKRVEIQSPKQKSQNTNKALTVTLQTQIKSKQTHKPPPVMITGVNNLEELTSFITNIIGDEHYQIKLMNNDVIKVNVTNDYAYRLLTNSLKNSNAL